jgi:hypothetical protein
LVTIIPTPWNALILFPLKQKSFFSNGITIETTILFKCFHNHCSQTINPNPANNFLQTYHYLDANPIVHNICMNEDLVPIINVNFFITNKNYIRRRSDNNYNLTFHLLMHEFDNFIASRIKSIMRRLFDTL